ncbi:hypothetical protein VE03_04844 [Pseudogymnoascus sp. 23342-1-I1]|nr:hypothetical protein VE03_04844 [Pseudogymnoascus sp. 23342-1-I1]
MTTDIPPPSLQPTQAATIVDVLNPSKEQRDSAYYSGASTNGDGSKREDNPRAQPARSFYGPISLSTDSNQFCTDNSIAAPQNTGSITPSPSTGYQSSTADMTPSPIATGHAQASQPLASPVSGGMSITSMVTSPTTPSSMDESMLAKLNPAYNAPGQRASTTSLAESRRESVDGRINSGFEGMRLQGNSPYASQNQSTTSIQSSLQQQRNPGLSVSSADRLSAPRFPNTYQPNSQRYAVRTAPTITGPAASAVANAAEPTKGQPWAFPDDTDRRVSMNPSELDSHATSYLESRRSSIADSMASSQYTTESRLPHGQRRLEEGYPQTEFPQMSRGSSEFHGAAHHHHSLQHRQVGDIRDEEGGSPGSTQPYSRTPELRKSHKLAERKRRNEMKELYDELREMLPSERGNKTSKWEILSKSIAQHKAQEDRYHNLEQHYRQMQTDSARKDAEMQRSRDETAELRAELRTLRHEFSLIRGDMVQPHAVPVSQAPPPVDNYTNDPYRAHARQEARPEVGLPPLRSLNTPIPAPFPQQQQPADSMTGVQYHQERPATNGYASAYQPRV